MEKNKRTADLVQNRRGREKIMIKFPKFGKRFPKDLAMIRSFDNRKFHNVEGDKFWIADISLRNIQKLVENGFEMDAYLIEKLKTYYIDWNKISDTEVGDPFLNERLRSFQKIAVNMIRQISGKGLIVLDMGLGKTICSLAFMRIEPKFSPVLIVVPASIKLQWRQEAMKWLNNPDIEIISGTTPYQTTGNIVIANYDIISERYKKNKETEKMELVPGTGWVEELKRRQFQLIILDEATAIKKSSANRTKAINRVGNSIPGKILLTGTPIENRPVEIYNGIRFIKKDLFPSKLNFDTTFCAGYHDGYGWNNKGHSNTKILHNTLVNTCLTYDSLVCLQHYGLIKIGEVVHKKLNDKILSYDTISSKIQWRQIEAHGSRIAPNTMLRIKHEFGELNCTPDHKIWTKEKGYIRAEKLTRNIHLYLVQEKNDKNITIKKCQGKILLSKMCSSGQKLYRRSIKENGNQKMGKVNKGIVRNKNMFSMWKNHIQKECKILQHLESSKVLFNKLQSILLGKEYDARTKRKKEKEIKSIIERKKTNRDSKNERGKKNCTKEIKRKKAYFGIKKKYVNSTKKEMETQKNRVYPKIYKNHSRGKKTEQNSWFKKRKFGIPCIEKKNRRFIQKGRRNSLFMGRYSNTTHENSNRSRWKNSSKSQSKSQRSLEGKRIKQTRVVSIESYKSRSSTTINSNNQCSLVYDLQVRENQNFFANGTLVHNCMFRRKKEDVLPELPDKTTTFIPVEIDNMKEYKEAEENFIAHVQKTKGKQAAIKASNAEVIAQINYLKQLAVKGKMQTIIAWIKEMLDIEDKLVVFINHRFVSEHLLKVFKGKALKIDGSISTTIRKDGSNQRNDIVQKFEKDDKIQLLVAQFQAGGVGLNLQFAHDGAHLELGWNSSTHEQAIDRMHRMEQKFKVNEYFFIGIGTIEEDIAKIIDTKKKVSKQITDGEVPEQESMLTKLIEKYKTKKEE